MRTLAAVLALLWMAMAPVTATGISDTFESYSLTTFPSPPWLDAATVFPTPLQSTPSAFVISTLNAFGAPTQALQIKDEISETRGIYFPVPVSANYSLAADIRPDRYSDAPLGTAADWAMQLTFAETSDNLSIAPQAGIYASSLSKTWRLFLIGGPGADIDFGISAALGVWYKVELDFDVVAARFHSIITDIATGTVLVDRNDVIAGLTPADAQYNAIAFIGGETSTGTDTVANLATVDNVNIDATGVIVPEPSTTAMLGSGFALLALFSFRRRK